MVNNSQRLLVFLIISKTTGLINNWQDYTDKRNLEKRIGDTDTTALVKKIDYDRKIT